MREHVGRPMMARRVVIVGLMVVTAYVTSGGVVAAATGGGASASFELASAKNAQPLSKAQYISHADALCAAARTAFASASSSPAFAAIRQGNPTAQEIAAFVAAFSSIVQNQIDKTRSLKPPKRDQSKVTKILQADQNALNMVKADPQLLAAAHSPFLAADTLARRYGLEGAPGTSVCSKSAG